MGKTIVFLNRLDDYWMEKIEVLRKNFSDSTFITYKDALHPRDLISSANGIVLRGAISEEEIKNAKNLEIIFIPWAGIDLLPKEIVKKRGIILANTHGNSAAVAEHAISLCLSLLGRVVEFHNDLKEGIWHGFVRGSPKEDLWTSLIGKKCGVLGLGNIGLQISKILKYGFNCYVIGFKKHPSKEKLESIDQIVFNLEEIVEKSEILFNTLPLTKETSNLLNWKILSRMKGKFLINVGRGLTVEEWSLYKALEEGILAGAAIDVWYNYPKSKEEVALPSIYPIHRFRNVVISPHVGGFTEKGQLTMVDETIENIASYLRTGGPLSRINLDLEY